MIASRLIQTTNQRVRTALQNNTASVGGGGVAATHGTDARLSHIPTVNAVLTKGVATVQCHRIDKELHADTAREFRFGVRCQLVAKHSAVSASGFLTVLESGIASGLSRCGTAVIRNVNRANRWTGLVLF